MRELKFIPTGEHTCDAVIVTAGESDAAAWQRAVPRPFPADHVPVLEWFTTPLGVECLRISVRHKDAKPVVVPSEPASDQARIAELLKMPGTELEDMAPRLGITDAHSRLEKRGGKLSVCSEIAKREAEAKK